MRKRKNIYILLCLFVLAFVFSCGKYRRNKMIPRDDMAGLYADMMLADQWIRDRGLDYASDSIAFYAPILKSKGYSVEDFRYSIDKYMDEPEKFIKVIDDCKNILESRLKEVERKIVLTEKLDSITSANKATEKHFSFRDFVTDNPGDSAVLKLLSFLPENIAVIFSEDARNEYKTEIGFVLRDEYKSKVGEDETNDGHMPAFDIWKKILPDTDSCGILSGHKFFDSVGRIKKTNKKPVVRDSSVTLRSVDMWEVNIDSVTVDVSESVSD